MSKKGKKFLLALLLVGAIVGGWAVWYVFYKPHRDVSSEKPAFTVSADAFRSEFASGDALAKYIEKAVLVEGAVTEIGESHISLGNIICNYDPEAKASFANVKEGQLVKIQGRVSTYNDLMDEIVVDKCALK